MSLEQRRAVAGTRRLAAGLLAIARGPALLAVGLAGLLLALVAPLTLALPALGTYWLVTERHTLATLLLWGGSLLLLRYGLLWSLLGVRRLAGLVRRLSESWAGVPILEPYSPPRRGAATGGVRRQLAWMLGDPATWRDLLWMVLNGALGWILVMAPTALFAAGVIAALENVGVSFPAVRVSPGVNSVRAVLGAGAAAFALWAAPNAGNAYFGFARSLLGPRGDLEMALRVHHLARTRAESLDANAAEIRRIERDLHDGTQARLVAMGMTLSAAKDLLDTDPEATRTLLTEAVDASVKALAELRALVRGIHPPVLADRGLVDAIRALALDCALPVELHADLSGRPSPPVESAAYFAVSELLANASRHSSARRVRVRVGYALGLLEIAVADDGQGGIDPAGGTGLRGIERRLAVFDGDIAISSPAGGPSVVRMGIPCELSSPKTSSS